MGNIAPDICRVCGLRPADSDEHFIPKGAGNRGRVNLLVMGDDGEYSQMPCTDGFYTSVLCVKCNNDPCSIYAQQYVSMLSALEQSAHVLTPQGNVAVTVGGLYPLRFMKQLILQYICTVPFPPEPVWRPLQDFVENRDCQFPPSAPRVFLYLNISRWGRVAPFCTMLELRTRRGTLLSEVSWPPLGVVFSYNEHPILSRMHEITDWGKYTFSEKKDVVLELARLQVASPYPMSYGSVQDAALNEKRRLPVFLLHIPEGSDYPTRVSALIERVDWGQ